MQCIQRAAAAAADVARGQLTCVLGDLLIR